MTHLAILPTYPLETVVAANFMMCRLVCDKLYVQVVESGVAGLQCTCARCVLCARRVCHVC